MVGTQQLVGTAVGRYTAVGEYIVGKYTVGRYTGEFVRYVHSW